MELKEVRQRGLTNLHLPGRFFVETMLGFMQKVSALLATIADQLIFAATVLNKAQAYIWRRCADETFGFLTRVAAENGLRMTAGKRG